MPDDGQLRGSILGNRVLRIEDPELLTGAAKFIADLDLDSPLHAVFVRSPAAHGTLTSIHVDDARQMPGVVAVWTAAELGVAPHHGFVGVHDAYLRPPLAVDRVRFVGEAYAVVLAETRAQATDAAEAVWAEIDALPAYPDAEAALASDAVAMFAGRPDNVAMAQSSDPPLDLEAISDVVVRGRYVNQRLAVAPMEPHGCAVAPGPHGQLTVWVPNQFPHLVRRALASAAGIDPERIRLIVPRVGGGFGGKAGLQHEYTVVTVAAERLGRPVVWIPTRSEDLQAFPHGRGQVHYGELGCRLDGTITGLRVKLIADGGGYPSVAAVLGVTTRRMSPGTYRIPAFEFDVVAATTTTGPMGAYRGAGRPEATALIERLIDQAADQLGIDPIEIRKRNLIPADAFPFTTITGQVYDSGNYAKALDAAAEAIGYDELRHRQAERRAASDPIALGIGVSSYVEITAGGTLSEYGQVRVHPDGSATILCGTMAHGQGHATSYAMLVSARTGIPVERIDLVDGDTDRVPSGGGTGGSRSMQIGGSAVDQATELLVERAKVLAAELLEADAADIVVDTTVGTIGVAGVPASALTWGELARRAEDGADGEPLTAETMFSAEGASYPFGAHIAVVEVDTETGKVRLTRHVAVDDCGTVINPLLVEGQQHGGVASGAGQALYEEVRFDADGNPLTSTFADYGVPSAAELPSFEVHSMVTPSPLNRLGAKGIGESATVGSTVAIQNAVIDALAHLGVRHVDMPCTAQRVWQAIAAARAGDADPWRPPPAIFATLAKAAPSGPDPGDDIAI